MSKIFFLYGSSPSISDQEIERIFSVKPKREKNISMANIAKQTVRKKFPALGGSVRAFSFLASKEKADLLLDDIFSDIQKNRTEGKKMRVGLFFYPPFLSEKSFTYQKKIKQFTKEENISLRIVNRGKQNLDSNAVQKEKLISEGNAEYAIIKWDGEFALLKTIAVQDIHPFIFRDTKKPVRDMQVGMLPPKLARTMINLSRDENSELPEKVYDPFCGTGTVLLEALDMGLKIAGSDISAKEVSATKKNVLWLYHALQGNSDDQSPFFLNDIFQKDAAKKFPDEFLKKVSSATVVSEGFLGKIFHSPVSEKQFLEQKDELFPLYRKFLFALSEGGIEKIVFAFPFWRGQKKRYSFTGKICEFAEKIAYTNQPALSYLRDGQVVGREIIIFTKQ